jgi:hypothetical protein
MKYCQIQMLYVVTLVVHVKNMAQQIFHRHTAGTPKVRCVLN